MGYLLDIHYQTLFGPFICCSAEPSSQTTEAPCSLTSFHSLCTLNSMLPHQSRHKPFDVAKIKSPNDLLKTNGTFWCLSLPHTHSLFFSFYWFLISFIRVWGMWSRVTSDKYGRLRVILHILQMWIASACRPTLHREWKVTQISRITLT